MLSNEFDQSKNRIKNPFIPGSFPYEIADYPWMNEFDKKTARWSFTPFDLSESWSADQQIEYGLEDLETFYVRNLKTCQKRLRDVKRTISAAERSEITEDEYWGELVNFVAENQFLIVRESASYYPSSVQKEARKTLKRVMDLVSFAKSELTIPDSNVEARNVVGPLPKVHV